MNLDKNDFIEAMSQRTDEELIKIITTEVSKYQTQAIEAAEEEVKRRKLDSSIIAEMREIALKEAEILNSIESEKVNLGIRALHLIVDTIAFFIVLSVFTFLFAGIFSTENESIIDIVNFVVIVFSYFGYYIFMEYKFQKTLGKFITKTIVVTTKKEKPTLGNIISRSLLRLIPFDWISFLFANNGFHDFLSSTIVVKDRS